MFTITSVKKEIESILGRKVFSNSGWKNSYAKTTTIKLPLISDESDEETREEILRTLTPYFFKKGIRVYVKENKSTAYKYFFLKLEKPNNE